MAYTALGNGFYAQTVTFLVSTALQTGALRAPQDGPIDYTAHPDLAEATAIALTDEDLDAPILALTGAEAVDTAGLRGDRRGAGGPPDPPGRRPRRRVSRWPDRPGHPQATGRHAPGPLRREPTGPVQRGRPYARPPDRPTTAARAGRLAGGNPTGRMIARHQYKGRDCTTRAIYGDTPMTDPARHAGSMTLPCTALSLARMGYGAMQLAGPGIWGPPRDLDAALAVLCEAVVLGINHIDTSDYYGPHVTNQIIRRALHPYPDDLGGCISPQ